MTDRYLFPRRLSRRDLLQWAGGAAAAWAVGSAATADEKSPAVRIGSGYFNYDLDPRWGQLPAGMSYGFGCALVVDGQDRIYVTSRSANPCVAIIDKDGKLLETWANDFAEKV